MENDGEMDDQASLAAEAPAMRFPHMVLVADGEDHIRELLLLVLHEAGYSTLDADNGLMAVELAIAHQPDAMILETALPLMEGLAVNHALKRNARTADIPVLFLSSLAYMDAQIQALDEGAADYITKPFDLREMLARLRVALTGSQRRRALMAEVAELRQLVGERRKSPVPRLRIFVASPSDVREEREVLGRVVQELNRTIGREKDVMLELIRWETDVVPDMGPPQDVINRQVERIGPYDIFVGIMWRRFGTPTEHAASGTSEEFQSAYEAYLATGRPRIMFYFKQAPVMPQTLYEAEQLVRVVAFRDELGKKGLYTTYDTAFDFERYVREHLTKRIGELLES